MAAFTLSPADPAIKAYYDDLQTYRHQQVTNELSIRPAFAALLKAVSTKVAWTLILEHKLDDSRARPDGTLFDNLRIPRGYWEAKDTKDNLETEIIKKIDKKYPTFNMIFENSEYGILYQDHHRVLEVDLRHKEQLATLLSRFFTYTGADIEKFQSAVREFQERIPRLAQGLIHRLAEEFTQNLDFGQAFQQFHVLCQQALHKDTSREVVEEMLVQHLITERLFRTVFDNPDFVRRNVIAAEIEKVIEALTNRAFKRSDFLGELDNIYLTLEENAKRIKDFSAKQPFLNVVYERFFQGFSVKQADTHGIIYTPQPIVDFMCASVEVILQQEFNLPLAAPTVQILDPCVGTGNFILNLLKRISRKDLQRKYENEIFCNEVLLLPYYIAALNIEHCYFELMNQYRTYPGICFVDTLNLAESPQLAFFNEENSERVARQKAAPLTVIIGNPPYNVGQKSENDNNKNRKYAVIDSRIHETYAKASRATNKNALSDAYVKFFRWAIDRLNDQDGIICFVSNNGFLDGIAFDSFRKHLAQDFTTIYHLNLGGNTRKGGGGSVFGIMVGVGITFLVRNSARKVEASSKVMLFYHALADQITGAEKLALLTKFQSVEGLTWQILQPDAKNNWLTEGLLADFETFLPLGTKEAKASKSNVGETIFKTFSNGVNTSRDLWVYNFNESLLIANIQRFIAAYNAEVEHWQQRSKKDAQVDTFVSYDDAKLKWSRDLKLDLKRGNFAKFALSKVRFSLYRPFNKQYFFLDRILNQDFGLFPRIFPTPASEGENLVICLTGIGSERPFMVLLTKFIADYHLVGPACSTQCFPFYTYAEDGSKRQENITAWAVKQFETQYGPDLLVSGFRQAQPPLNRGGGGPGTERAEGKVSASSDLLVSASSNLLVSASSDLLVSASSTSEGSLPELAEGHGSTKKAIFFYVYALLHHPLYRERYKENLKRELPRLPLVGDRQTFLTLVEIGQKLADLHLNYEMVAEYPLEWVEKKKVPWTWHVEKMKLTKEKDAIIVNRCLTLKGLPARAFEYQLGHRSALEWVLDQYQITTDQRSGITNDPNRGDEPQYIVRLIGKVITVSVETVKLVERLREVSL